MLTMDKISYRNSSDNALVLLVIEGDNTACSTLMHRYDDSLRFELQKMVHNKTDSKDLTIQGFAKAFINIHQYSPKFAFSTWLFSIAKNNCIDFLRKEKLRKKTFTIDTNHQNSEGLAYTNILRSKGYSPEEQLIRKQRARLLYKAVSKLNQPYRSVIKFYYFKELSTAEVAERLDIPVNRVKLYLFRGRKKLNKLYGMS